MNKIRIGFGFDVHRLTENRPLFLGGIQIPFDKGLQGHSDSDVVIHALCDAILGAANLRDIGFHFPDTAEEFKGIDSKLLLQKTMNMLLSKGFVFGNADITICAERPKLSTYIPAMQICLSNVMQVSFDDISIKATTSEKMGYVGREEGIAAYACVLIS